MHSVAAGVAAVQALRQKVLQTDRVRRLRGRARGARARPVPGLGSAIMPFTIAASAIPIIAVARSRVSGSAS
jgi:hypothetical protein